MSEANVEQRKYWNEVSGPKWVRVGDIVNGQIEGLGREGMEALGLEAGQRVLDVGCGCGQTSLELARRVGATGEVVGVDVSRPMLEDARRRAREAGLGNVAFVEADAQTHAFVDAPFDAVFSRFGVMFFEDPVAAFRNLRRALAPGGRLAFVCWQAVGLNQWITVPLAAVAKHVDLPTPGPPGSPGPFAFADEARVRSILDQAGFADVGVESLERDVRVAAGLDLDGAVDFVLEIGPSGAAMREASESVREAVTGSVREAVAEFVKPDGLVMKAAAWRVSARQA